MLISPYYFLSYSWISEFTKLKKSIPKNWLNELESENSTKTAVKTNKILYINENSINSIYTHIKDH
jgi:hypothetical protein